MAFDFQELRLVDAVGAARRSLAWWWRGLIACIPVGVRAWLAMPARAFRLKLGETSDQLYEESGGFIPGRRMTSRFFAEHQRGDDLAAALRGLPRRVPLIVELPQALCLMRRVDVPLASLANADGILDLDIDRLVPIARTELVSGWRVARIEGDTATLAHAVIKRAAIAHILEGAGDRPVSLEVNGGDVPAVTIALPETEARTSRRIITGMLAATATLAVGLIGLNAYLELQRQGVALAGLDAGIEKHRASLAALRKRQAEADERTNRTVRLRSRKVDEPGVVAFWELLTVTLPESVWLSEVRTEGGAAVIDGYAKSAAELIGILDRTGQFSSVSFSSPVSRDGQRDVERFQIRLQTKHDGGSSSSVSPWRGP